MMATNSPSFRLRSMPFSTRVSTGPSLNVFTSCVMSIICICKCVQKSLRCKARARSRLNHSQTEGGGARERATKQMRILGHIYLVSAQDGVQGVASHNHARRQVPCNHGREDQE